MHAKVNLNLPSSLWTARDSARLGLNTVAAVKLRTSKGIDADGQPFKPYSTSPIYIPRSSAVLSPKGGRVSRTGQSVYYQGGYREYKAQSRRYGATRALLSASLIGCARMGMMCTLIGPLSVYLLVMLMC
jgi:hypothetical protein